MKIGPFWIGFEPPPQKVETVLQGDAEIVRVYFGAGGQRYATTAETALRQEKLACPWRDSFEINSCQALRVGSDYFLCGRPEKITVYQESA